ncbi:MAG: hypothetical protein AAF191_07430 [Verrucomicrobiota bacterium]
MRESAHHQSSHLFPRESASALLAIYWILALLTMLVFGGAQLLLAEREAAWVQQDRAKANWLAEMGLNVAAHPEVEDGEEILSQEFREGQESFHAWREAESARLNLNALLVRREEEVLVRLFETWGASPVDSAPLIEALLDWVDADDGRMLQGAESRDYAKIGAIGFPRNRPFQSFSEVQTVMGIDWLNGLQPGWTEFFTLYGDGRLALQDASAELIAATCGCSLLDAEELVTLRRGPDGEAHTEDDVSLESVESALALLGIGGPELASVRSRVTLAKDVLRLRSRGQVGTIGMERWLVVEGRGSGMRILAAGSNEFWEENEEE